MSTIIQQNHLPHEKLDAFNVAVQLVEDLTQLRLARGNGAIGDQLKRASSSIASWDAKSAESRVRNGAKQQRGSFCDMAHASFGWPFGRPSLPDYLPSSGECIM